MLSSSIKLLVLTPLILVRYNINEIAFWYLLLTINSFAIVIDFGFYPSFSRITSFAFFGLESLTDVSDGNHKHLHGKPNWPLLGKIYGTINSTYLAISLLVVVLIVGFTYEPISSVILKTNNQGQLWDSYYLYVASVFISFFSRKFDSVIIGTNNIVVINRWDIMNNFLNVIVSVLIVYFHYSLLVLCFAQVIFSVILITRDYFLEREICDGKFKEFKFFSFHKDVFLWCWAPTWRSGILILCSTGINQATGLIYSNVSDSAKLAAYLLTLKLITTISQFSQAPFYSKLPAFSGLRVKNDLSGLINITAISIKRALLVYVIGISVLIFFGQWGLTLIGSKAKLIDYNILIVLGLIWFLERHHAMHAQIVVTTNKIPFYKSAIISGVVNIGLIYIFLPKIDVWAFPLAQGVSNLIINNWWNVYLSIKSLRTNFLWYFKRSALLPAAILIMVCIIRVLINRIY